MSISAAIVGVTGYTGLELLRLLSQHPFITISHIYAHQHAGKALLEIFPHCVSYVEKLPETIELFQPDTPPQVDVVFLALPHAQSWHFVESVLKKGIKIIDLSADFRLKKAHLYPQYYGEAHPVPDLLSKACYGLPELYREKLVHSSFCANPGCYSTAAILALYPLAKSHKLSSSIVIDAKSGVSGAGKALKETSLFCEVNEYLSPYSTFSHRHVPEIEQELGTTVFFSPHLVPMSRGILCSVYLDNTYNFSLDQLLSMYKTTYKEEPFIYASDSRQVSTKWVVGSNHCAISLHIFQEAKKIVIFSAIDNLLKGASGQAIQNMNIMFGFPETTGLPLIARLP